MAFKIAIASGKGGTGKTTVSVNLLHYISKYMTQKVQLVDCDVEEPNDILFFKKTEKISEKTVTQAVPKIDSQTCTFCRKCVTYCEFNAIVVVPGAKFAEVQTELCHSCGACSVACEFDAIKEFPHPIGTIHSYNTGVGNGLTEGVLKIGSAMQTLLIRELKKEIQEDNHDIILYDAPPGTCCPVVETVVDTDYVILVTEPTPFGLYDLSLSIDLLRETNKAFGIVMNKAGTGFTKIYDYLKEEQVEILCEIPFSKDYASNYAKGNLFHNLAENIDSSYKLLINKIRSKLENHA